MNRLTEWPSEEALSDAGLPPLRTLIKQGGWIVGGTLLAWGSLVDSGVRTVTLPALGACFGVCVAAFWAFREVTARHRLLPGAALLVTLLAAPVGVDAAGARDAAVVLWLISATLALHRLPLAVGLPGAVVALTLFGLTRVEDPLTSVVVAAAVMLSGYTVRLDAQARGDTLRLLAQEQAARRAEAESAALTERARIAREIHDVLAHSLSAQLVHLEGARLLLERDADRSLILERVSAARGMARDGLAETRQALSALRGELVPVEDFLRESAAAEGARFESEGEPRRLTAEAGLAVRRVAQEALTNVRKHAPGAEVRVRFAYLEDAVMLEVQDDGGRAGSADALDGTGAGYGLLGMRERAELLGGTLEAGPAAPDQEGFVVRLRVPA